MADKEETEILRMMDSFYLPPGVEPTATMRILHGAYQSANVIEAMESGNFSHKVNCPVSPKCCHCGEPAHPMSKPLGCSGCRAFIYCSRQCQVAHWKTGDYPHKLWCARDKEYMKRRPYFLSQIKQFPWSRIESDGTFSHRIYEARLGVYGPGLQFGFWSVPISPDFYDQEHLPHPKGYIHGEMMLERKWPDHIDAWKLGHMNAKGDIIPRLSFTTEFPPPPKVEQGQIRDWQSWYSWRGLSMASPAALLMHYPLTVYHILVDVLQVAKCRNISSERRALQIHYIGAEKELNHLPLFSELALLLPCMDITIVVFGKPAYELVEKAHKSHPDSIATKEIVWRYTAPQATGGGSIKIKLYSKSEYWTGDVLEELEPDALIGLNAGLGTYSTWKEPVQASWFHRIPFGSTDYEEEGSQRVAEGLMVSVQRGLIAGALVSDAVPRTFPVTPNPFHMPGQQQVVSLRLPTLGNGFVMVVFRAEESGSKE